jgi:hypothetical protein
MNDPNVTSCPHCNEDVDTLDDPSIKSLSRLNDNEMEVAISGNCPSCGRAVITGGTTSMVSIPSWDFELKKTHHNDYDQQHWLDADPCPHCGSLLFNVALSAEAQFVGAAGQWKNEFEENGGTIDRSLNQADDGPWIQSVTFVRCSNCETVLYDEDDE